MTLRSILIPSALLGCLATALAPAEPPAKAQSPESVRDLVYWGAGGPTRIRLRLRIAGRPADLLWSEAVEALFAFCDRNGDGVLDPAEYAPFVEQRRGRVMQIALDEAAGLPALRLDFDRRNAKVTRAIFDSALREAGFGPVVLSVRRAQPDSQRLSSIFFRRLDRDGDGKLSTAELRDARDRLAFFDANEDEFISVTELLGNVDASPIAPAALQRSDSSDATDSTFDLVLLPPDREAAVQQIVASRGDAKRKAIRCAEFGGDERTFAALDKNSDGKLDAAELEGWLKQPPDLEIVVSAGTPLAPGQSTHRLYTLVSEPGSSKLRVQTAPGIEASSERFYFRFDQPVAVDRRGTLPSREIDVIRAEMKRLADGKGIVQRKQVEASPRQPGSFAALAFFDFADRNADGKLETAEVEAALKVLAPLFAGCRMRITVQDQGTGLFELLDRNGDSRLSPRELVNAIEVLKPFADSTGKVSPAALPRRFFVQIAVEPLPIFSFPAPIALAKPSALLERTPAWFYDMDRNGDGEVSLREFLGPIELFRKLDKNGDGLISLDEARATQIEKSGR